MSRSMWIIVILITILMMSSFWFGRKEVPPWVKCKESLFEQVVFNNCTPSLLDNSDPSLEDVGSDENLINQEFDDQGLPLELPDSN